MTEKFDIVASRKSILARYQRSERESLERYLAEQQFVQSILPESSNINTQQPSQRDLPENRYALIPFMPNNLSRSITQAEEAAAMGMRTDICEEATIGAIDRQVRVAHHRGPALTYGQILDAQIDKLLEPYEGIARNLRYNEQLCGRQRD